MVRILDRASRQSAGQVDPVAAFAAGSECAASCAEPFLSTASAVPDIRAAFSDIAVEHLPEAGGRLTLMEPLLDRWRNDCASGRRVHPFQTTSRRADRRRYRNSRSGIAAAHRACDKPRRRRLHRPTDPAAKSRRPHRHRFCQLGRPGVARASARGLAGRSLRSRPQDSRLDAPRPSRAGTAAPRPLTEALARARAGGALSRRQSRLRMRRCALRREARARGQLALIVAPDVAAAWRRAGLP